MPEPATVPLSEWRWSGMPGHLIVSASCCFHLVTDIGRVRVSTIGCYHRCPEGDRDYSNRLEIGYRRLYETYVFEIGADGEIVPSELDSEGYMEEDDANAGHMRMCKKWAALGGDPERASDA